MLRSTTARAALESMRADAVQIAAHIRAQDARILVLQDRIAELELALHKANEKTIELNLKNSGLQQLLDERFSD
jgi:hypothetical protein